MFLEDLSFDDFVKSQTSTFRLCFDKPVLSKLFILREPQDERRVEGLSMSGKIVQPEPVEGYDGNGAF
jgi:hypothetical protein